ncbi:nucleolar GTP-binding protein 1 [Heterostelium album PN500]|uniref:Nucleolar GTP-binding protein 1 n=1 Tax=Heterostelium pallidum (strain ATCC 26659 / Pp 5 / PN500) TaxID=670386 RepID=D3BNF4_HETP5|nr:nucleolar GTP-binding protein 1 [Heterostelium album PN500]EFA76814.1 nucleolar GTP-binding protein 1 [Heterostelium album PN500]|eukprot:XP_020428946.1 nucleolar GTP-binding protein 1 [Heterostelium album PN500]
MEMSIPTGIIPSSVVSLAVTYHGNAISIPPTVTDLRLDCQQTIPEAHQQSAVDSATPQDWQRLLRVFSPATTILADTDANIQVVPTSKDFVDIVLSKTQRKTPTEIHKQYAISRIRSFYMRKVKYTQQSYHDKLSQIIQDFPLLDDIHPFYSDLINVLYDKDHYKLALGQLNTARNLIDNLSKDYLRLLKYGDSLYRCKQLKRAALGPLFLNKPLLILINKIDVRKPEEVPADDWALIQSLADPARGGIGGTKILPMSTLTEEGVANVKDVACTTLLEERVEKKMKSAKIQKDMHLLHLAMPVARDNKKRPSFIPPSVLAARAAAEANQDEDEKKFKLTPAQMESLQEEEDDIKYQQGILPIYDVNEWKRKYLLRDDSWKFDIIPEIMDGKNIADFVDPDILERLEELEREEDALLEQLKNNMEEDESDLDEENLELYDEIQEQKHANRVNHEINDSSKPKLPKHHLGINTTDMSRNLRRMGVDQEEADDIIDDVRSRSRSKSRTGRKRDRSEEREASQSGERGISLNRSQSRSRSKTPAPVPGEGYRDLAHKLLAEKLNKDSRRKRNKLGYKGEGDHHIPNEMPKHLFAGKRKAVQQQHQQQQQQPTITH